MLKYEYVNHEMNFKIHFTVNVFITIGSPLDIVYSHFTIQRICEPTRVFESVIWFKYQHRFLSLSIHRWWNNQRAVTNNDKSMSRTHFSRKPIPRSALHFAFTSWRRNFSVATHGFHHEATAGQSAIRRRDKAHGILFRMLTKVI